MNLICGINPVLEALQSGTRHFDRLLIVKGLRSRRLSEAMRRATQLGLAPASEPPVFVTIGEPGPAPAQIPSEYLPGSVLDEPAPRPGWQSFISRLLFWD